MRLIDADVLLKKSFTVDDLDYYEVVDVSDIKEAPTINAEPVRYGKWKQDGDDIICSECGHAFNVIDNCTELFDYCPKCGAKMDGGEK